VAVGVAVGVALRVGAADCGGEGTEDGGDVAVGIEATGEAGGWPGAVSPSTPIA
jgi:hypothetical protein